MSGAQSHPIENYWLNVSVKIRLVKLRIFAVQVSVNMVELLINLGLKQKEKHT
jgi:hypothetical protein